MSNLIEVETLERGIVSVVLNRASRRNALNIDLLEQLQATIDRLARDEVNRVIILRGAGPVFCAGLDLQEAADSALVERSAIAVKNVLDLLQATPLITIASVQGGAFAGGAGVMAACDIAIASADAKFAFPEARRGLLPALIYGVLKNRIREGDLRELFLVGEPIDANRAQQVGLVQRVVANDRLLEESLAVARSIVAGGPNTIRQTKAMLNAATQASGKSDDDLISTHLAARQSTEAREGLSAFLEKRKPDWT